VKTQSTENIYRGSLVLPARSTDSSIRESTWLEPGLLRRVVRLHCNSPWAIKNDSWPRVEEGVVKWQEFEQIRLLPLSWEC